MYIRKSVLRIRYTLYILFCGDTGIPNGVSTVSAICKYITNYRH